jgi:hypothetical protein
MTALGTHLALDHRAMEELLDLAGGGDPGGAIDGEAFERFRARLLRHIAIEEKLLFPAARRAGAGPALLERLQRLRVEHAAITTLLVPTPDAALIDELRRALGPHDTVEEAPGGVYQECEALIGDGSGALLQQVLAYPQVKVARHVDRPGSVRTLAEALARAQRIEGG